MTQYLLSMYQPDGVTPPAEALAKVMQDLKTLIDDAERAIAVRSVSLDPVQDAEEAQRLADAAHNLSVLRREAR